MHGNGNNPELGLDLCIIYEGSEVADYDGPLGVEVRGWRGSFESQPFGT